VPVADMITLDHTKSLVLSDTYAHHTDTARRLVYQWLAAPNVAVAVVAVHYHRQSLDGTQYPF
jgi:hypothetical protein